MIVAAHRVIVLSCQDWSVTAARHDDTDLGDSAPLAITAHGVITHCCLLARSRGVFPGQRLRDAQVTAPDLRVITDSPERDSRVWQQLLNSLGDTVARIAVLEPGLMAVSAPGLARYYGSEHAGAHALLAATTTSGVPVVARVGIADTLFAAIQAAHYGTSNDNPVCQLEPGSDADFLAPLPVSVLGATDVAQTLSRLGVVTLADFAALESTQVADRFGADVSLLHACAKGRDPRTAPSRDIPASTDRRWRADQPVVRVDTLGFVLRATVEEFLAGLTAQQLVCTSVRITLIDDRGEQHVQVWSHPKFFTTADVINRVRWQWESQARQVTEEYHDGGIQEVIFQALSPDHLFDHEPGLWGGGDRDARIEHTLSHIQSQWGHRSVSQAVCQPGHRFDDRQQWIAWGTTPPASTHDPRDTQGSPSSFVGQIPRPLPATVFDPPHVVALEDDSGSPLAIDCEQATLCGQPATMWRGSRSRQLVAWAGPWPVVERWWDSQRAYSLYRLQLLDQEGVGWLVSHDPVAGHWHIEARYD